MTLVTLDIETRSYADLGQVGQHAYFLHPTTDVICVCWGIDAQPVRAWWPTHICPTYLTRLQDDTEELFDAIANGAEIECHNTPFELESFENVLGPKYGWPIPKMEQWRDVMAVACYYAMPAKLDKLARALGYPPKNPEGARLITKYSKLYLKTAKTEIPPEDFEKWLEYCKDDVLLEQAISDELGDLPDRELWYYLLDLKINKRGLKLDLEGIAHATATVDKITEELTGEFRELTGINPTQWDKVLEWFNDHGLELENLQKDYLNEMLDEGEIPQGDARRALEIRVEVAKASTRKLDKMANVADDEGIARWQTRYHGTQTGRNAGQGFQPLNMSRGFERNRVLKGGEWPAPEDLVSDISFEDPDWLRTQYKDPMAAIGNATRHWIIAGEGYKIVAGDFTSIEAVILSCLAGEKWKIDAFRKGEKIYERMGEKIHKLPYGTVTKETHPDERFDGKTGELAFGYQGALGAWLKFDSSGRHTDERIIEICKSWRTEHPNIVNMWYRMDDAAIEAVTHPGRVTGHREIGFEIVDDWLSMILPNGKRIWYYKPELRSKMPQWHQPWNPETHPECAEGDCDCKPQPCVSYMAQKEGQWKRITTYGGKLTENATQAVSREVLKPAVKRAEDAGYPVILTVYDEIVCRVPENRVNAAEFERLMVEPLKPWCEDWPVRADVWIGDRYKK